SPVNVTAAFGYNDSTSGWTSRGSWNLSAGNCTHVLKGNLNSRIYYVYAVGEDRRSWVAMPAQGGSFCMGSSDFISHNRDNMGPDRRLNCEAKGLHRKRFSRVDTEGAASFTYDLTIPGEPTPPTHAQPTPAPKVIPDRPGRARTACQRFPNLC